MIKRGIVIPEYEELMNESDQNGGENQNESGESVVQDHPGTKDESSQDVANDNLSKTTPDVSSP
jgi:hypothetical protein